MGNRVVDGSFEDWASATDLTYWSEAPTGGSTVNRAAWIARSGKYSVQLDVVSGAAVTLRQVLKLQPSRRYRLSFWYATNDISATGRFKMWDISATVYLQADGSWGASAEHVLSSSRTGTWKKYSIEFTAHADYRSYTIELSFNSGTTFAVFYDDVSVEPLNPCGFAWDNKWDVGTLTASLEATNFPATNTRHRWHKKTWRSTALTDPQWLKFDRGASFSSSQVAILRKTNLTTVAEVHLCGNATDVWTAPSFDSGHLDVSEDLMVYLWKELTSGYYRWWRWAFTDTSNPDGYIEIGRVFFGDVFTPERNFTLGGGRRQLADPSVGRLSEDGQISSIQLSRYNSLMEYTFERLSLADKERFLEMFTAVGNWKPLFFIEDLGDPWGETFYVRIAEHEITPLYNNCYTIRVTLEELR